MEDINKLLEELKNREQAEKAFTEFMINKIIPDLKNSIEEIMKNIEFLSKLTGDLAVTIATNIPSINEFIKNINANQTKVDELNKKFDELNKKIQEITKSLGTLGSQLTVNPTPAPPQAGAVAQGSQPGPVQAPVQSGGKAEKPQVAGGQPAVQPEKQQVSQPKAQSEKVKVNLNLKNMVYVAVIKGRDERYGFQREFLTEKGKVLSNFTGELNLNDIIEVKLADGTKKYFKVTGRTISGVEDANDLPK